MKATLAKLVPNTTYHYQLFAYNTHDKSKPVGSGDQEVTTPAIRPVPAGSPPSSVSATAATLNGAVNPEHSTSTYRFEYGPCITPAGCASSGYPDSAPAPEGEAGSGFGAVTVSGRVEELQPGTAYHYRVEADDPIGEATSAEAVFTTASVTLPVVTTGPANDVSQAAATISGTIDPEGVATTYEWEVGTGVTYGMQVFGSAGQGSGPQSVTLALGSLTPGTTYHYRLLASNRYRTVYGADEIFTTPGHSYASTLTVPPMPVLITSPSFPPVETTATTINPKALTRAQKLAAALKTCRTKSKGKRAKCEKQARRKYAPAKAGARKKHH